VRREYWVKVRLEIYSNDSSDNGPCHSVIELTRGIHETIETEAEAVVELLQEAVNGLFAEGMIDVNGGGR
jgi:hypothetical protein